MNNRLTQLMAGATLAAGLVFAQAAPARPAHPFGPRARMHRLVQALDLTADQKAQAKEILKSAGASAQPLRQQMRDARQQLRSDIKTAAPAEVVTKDSNTVGQLTSQLTAIRTTAMQKLYGILTPDQKAKLDTLAEQWRARRGQPG